VVATEISRDGTMSGPDTEGLAAVLAATGLAVIASGGVATVEDLGELAATGDTSRRLAGVIVGRALYEGRFTVEQALEALKR